MIESAMGGQSQKQDDSDLLEIHKEVEQTIKKESRFRKLQEEGNSSENSNQEKEKEEEGS